MTTITAKIIADSVSPDGKRLTSIHMRYPRFIHAELMTHRMFSRNARSSRAVPVETMLKEIENDPVIPLHWGANQKGMQAGAECNERVLTPTYDDGMQGITRHTRERAWLEARDFAMEVARGFSNAGYHKQVVNRLLEPFMHIDVLVSATEWANFLTLRDHHMAEPHIADLAREVRAALDGNEPTLLQPGEWHLPYVQSVWTDGVFDGYRHMLEDESDWVRIDLEVALKLSVARCARISYKPFDGNGSLDAEIKRHDDLVGAIPMHASPAEHQATPDVFSHTTFEANKFPIDVWENQPEHGNFIGWRQYRKTLQGENTFG